MRRSKKGFSLFMLPKKLLFHFQIPHRRIRPLTPCVFIILGCLGKFVAIAQSNCEEMVYCLRHRINTCQDYGQGVWINLLGQVGQSFQFQVRHHHFLQVKDPLACPSLFYLKIDFFFFYKTDFGTKF